MTAHRCAGGLKKLDLRLGSHAIDISFGSLTRPSKHRYRATLFTVIPRNRPTSVAFYDAHGDTEDLFSSCTLRVPTGVVGGKHIQVKNISVQRKYTNFRKTEIDLYFHLTA